MGEILEPSTSAQPGEWIAPWCNSLSICLRLCGGPMALRGSGHMLWKRPTWLEIVGLPLHSCETPAYVS